MHPRSAARSSGLDVSLLGGIAAGIGLSAERVPFGGGTPDLIRFADVGPDYVPVAAMPQESALLLLVQQGPSSAPAPPAGPSLWTALLVVGLLLVVAGPVWAWLGRRDD